VNKEEYQKLQIEGSDWSYNSRWGDQMEAAILEYLGNKPKDSRVLDLGCGEGRGLKALLERDFLPELLYGIDLSPEKVAAANNAGLPQVLQGDMHEMLLEFADDFFDYCFFSHAIEHTLDPSLVIQEVQRVSKAGLIIVPIDPSKQPPLGESPHTHNFASKEEWFNLFNKVNTKYAQHLTKDRLGKEIWTTFWRK